jgi:hypothetical protein
MIGAGKLVASLWKLGDERAGWQYRFNIFKQSKSGRVGQRFCPGDVRSLVKLARVLAAELATDGCLAAARRDDLAQLAAELDQIILYED